MYLESLEDDDSGVEEVVVFYFVGWRWSVVSFNLIFFLGEVLFFDMDRDVENEGIMYFLINVWFIEEIFDVWYELFKCIESCVSMFSSGDGSYCKLNIL